MMAAGYMRALRRPSAAAAPGPAAAAKAGTTPPFLAQRPRRQRQHAVRCHAGPPTPWRFDDLRASSSSPTTFDGSIKSSAYTFDELWREQIRGMERAQAEMAEMQRLMDQQFAAAQAEAQQLEQQAGAGSREEVEQQQQQQQGGPGGHCGYRWQRSYQRSGGDSYLEWRSESFAVVGVQPPGCHGMGMQVAAPPSALHLGPLSGLGLLLAAGVAGFWMAVTAAFHRHFHLTVYREGSRWYMLLLWPLLLLFSPQFREQFVAAMRGGRAPAAPGSQKQQQQTEEGGGEQYGVPGMQVGEQA